MPTVPKLRTVVTNPTAVSQFYAYVTPLGRRIAAAGSFTIDGDIRVGMKQRYVQGLDADIDTGRVTIGLTIDGDNGTPAGTGVTSSTVGSTVRTTKLAFANTPLPLIDAAGVVAYVGLKVFDFPAGAIQFMGATIDLVLTRSSAGVNDNWDGDVSLGTVTADAGATLATTEQNLVPTTGTPPAVAGVATAKAASTSTEGAKVFNGTGTAIDVFLNVLVDDADHNVTATPCNLIANGSITLVWGNLGDV
jgi:hypothetical protein